MCVLCVLEQHLSLLYSGGQAAATMALCEFVAVLPQSPNAKILSASLHNQLRQTVCIYLFTHFVHVRTDVSATAQVRGNLRESVLFFLQLVLGPKRRSTLAALTFTCH